jgi:hypothetical protein
MQRRVFVKLSACTAAVLTLPLLQGCGPGQLDAASQPIFFSHLVDAKTIAKAGKAYLAAHPGEKDVDKLKALLLPKNGQPSDVNAIGRSLVVSIANDFHIGNTVTVSGWVLATTEARQCALYYLLQS